jgi:aspartate/methionine/tyrosine aminotransferase
MRSHDTPEVSRFAAMRRALAQARDVGYRRWGRDFIDLGRSEPLAAWPDDRQLQRRPTADRLTRLYGPVAGWADVRASVADHYAKTLGVPLRAGNILISSGALSGLTVALSALCRPGGAVAMTVPYYHAWPSIVELMGGRPRPVPIGDGGRMTFVVPTNDRLDAVLFANPNNPTGMTHDRDALDAVTADLGPDVAVVADEVYAEYIYAPAGFTSLATVLPLQDGPDWVVVRSAAKTLGRPGLRVGVVIAPVAVIEAVTDRAAALTGSASTLAQFAFADGLAVMHAADHMRPYRSRLELALAISHTLGLTAQRPQGTFYLWVDGPGLGPVETAVRLCLEAGVFVWPGQYFGSPSHVRVSLSASRASIETGLRRIADSLDFEAVSSDA